MKTKTNKDKLIAKNQSVGNGFGMDCIRDLYERPDGSRYSVIVRDWSYTPAPWERKKIAAIAKAERGEG